ncbi:M20/M25/M40 family metallo-hydrolase [Nonomuraea guangzhouensis]|uniref:M20/M25/M40 family metallo-hydrolase n=1 Tax=Nonomuraea guangzhouensis TaxID=1291555 RepID=A0ABW4GYZ3_9ACTN|nr:M20/M25/M40 family metallo-hydrolase [Nonomuraea guangzhouensis]
MRKWLALLPVALVVASLLTIRPSPPPGPFSVERAMEHIRRIAVRPHPIGSAANAAVRDYVTAQLKTVGLTPSVERAATAVVHPERTYRAGTVENVRAAIPGRDSTDKVLLVAHYDSVTGGPGASDDGLGVATLLEIARLLRMEPQQRNTVELLFTDGEEAGTLGAHAYLAGSAAPSADHTVVLNLEARGTTGPVVMFQTGPGNSGLVSALRGGVPFATSFTDEVYRRLPNDTDLTQFLERGFTGMNFAVIGGSARYHTTVDDLGSVDPATLRQMGTTVLAASRELAQADPRVRDRTDASYFTVLGLLVSYPLWLAGPLAGCAVAGCVAAIAVARRRGVLRLRALGVAGVGLLVPVIGAAVVGWVSWQGLLLWRTDYRALFSGEPYWSGVAAGLVLVTVVLGLVWAGLARRRATEAELAGAVCVWFAVLAVLLAVFVPGAAYLFTWPAIVGAAGVFLSAVHRPFYLSAAGVVAVLLFTPLIVLFFPALGLGGAPVPLVLTVLGVLACVPYVPPARRRAGPVGIASIVVLAVVVLVAGAVLDRVDARHPAQVSLLYTADADTGRARWAGRPAGDWQRRYVSGGPTSLEADFPMLLTGDGYHAGPAPAEQVPTPKVTGLRAVTVGSAREYVVDVAIGPGTATGLAAYLDAGPQTVESVTISGVRLPGGHNRPFASTPWRWGVELAGPGTSVRLTVRARDTRPIRLRLVARGTLTLPLPPDLTWSAADSGETLAARTVQLK